VRHLVQAQSDATLEEWYVQLHAQRGLYLSVPTLLGMVTSLGLPRKKNRSIPPSARRRGSSTPARPIASVSPHSPSDP
jgi:hypothetical protein